MYKLKGLTNAEAFAKKKVKGLFEINQKIKQSGNKYTITPAADTFIIEINHGSIRVKEGCLTPSKIRFLLYNKKTETGNAYELLDQNIIDCYYNSKNDFEDEDCEEIITKCEEKCDEICDEEICEVYCAENCRLAQTTLFETFFTNTEDGNRVCTTT